MIWTTVCRANVCLPDGIEHLGIWQNNCTGGILVLVFVAFFFHLSMELNCLHSRRFCRSLNFISGNNLVSKMVLTSEFFFAHCLEVPYPTLILRGQTNSIVRRAIEGNDPLHHLPHKKVLASKASLCCSCCCSSLI